jgi:hypothetical protein
VTSYIIPCRIYIPLLVGQILPLADSKAADNTHNSGRGFTCGINEYQVFGVNRNSLMLIIQVLSVVLGAVSAGLHGNETAALVLGISVAALNGVAVVLKTDPGEQAPMGRIAKPAGLL